MLYAVTLSTPALINGQGCLRESNKSDLAKRLSIVEISWPYCRSLSNLVAYIKEGASMKSFVFDKYQDISDKDHGKCGGLVKL